MYAYNACVLIKAQLTNISILHESIFSIILYFKSFSLSSLFFLLLFYFFLFSFFHFPKMMKISVVSKVERRDFFFLFSFHGESSHVRMHVDMYVCMCVRYAWPSTYFWHVPIFIQIQPNNEVVFDDKHQVYANVGVIYVAYKKELLKGIPLCFVESTMYIQTFATKQQTYFNNTYSAKVTRLLYGVYRKRRRVTVQTTLRVLINYSS